MSTSLGNQAESSAAQFLIDSGFIIIDRNWRTRVCEIDIIATKGNVIYFVEVKYRSHNSQGTGIEYITPKKLQQMQFAARCWMQENKSSKSYEVSAIEVAGPSFTITEFLPQIL